LKKDLERIEKHIADWLSSMKWPRMATTSNIHDLYCAEITIPPWSSRSDRQW